MVKVLHITNNYPTPNYPIFGIFVKEQINSLNDLGVNNDVFFMNTREGGKKEYLKSLFKLHTYFYHNKYDLIHCHHSYSSFIFLCSVTILGKKCILSYQNDPKNEGGNLLFRILLLFFDKIILKNKISGIKCDKIVYLPNGVDTNLFRPRDKSSCKKRLGLKENKKYIVFMDSYTRRTQKRIDRFNETIRILREDYLLSEIEPLILTNTERSLIPYLLCASELHLLTSDFEGSPNSVKECLACNVPVVSTPVGNVADLIGDIEGCFVSESFNPEELAELASKTLRIKNFSSRGSLMEKGLGIKEVGLKLLEIYNELISNESHG
ncbi:MAG: glycosyltransferase family 4 protein [Candidatus Thorarchaeota archaeon]